MSLGLCFCPIKYDQKWVSYLGIERYHYCGQSSMITNPLKERQKWIDFRQLNDSNYNFILFFKSFTLRAVYHGALSHFRFRRIKSPHVCH